MKGLTTEAKVGIAVLIGLILLTYMTFKVGGFAFLQEEGYRLNATFPSASGLDKRAPVRVAGVEVGKVESIELVEGGAKVIFKISSAVKIKKGGHAAIRSEGLLGDRFIEIVPGKENDVWKDGETIPIQEAAPDLENLMGRFSSIAEDVKAVTASLREVLGSTEGKQNLKEVLENAKGLTKGINEWVQKNQEPLSRSVANFEDFSKSLKEQGNELVESLTRMAQKMERGEGTLGKLINDDEAYEKLTRSLDDLGSSLKGVENLTKKVERGEGTIGKLFTDESAYENINSALEGISGAVSRIERFRTHVGFRNEYQLQESQNKGYFTIQLQPRADKFYRLEIVDDPRGRVTEKTTVVTTNGVPSTITELETQRRLKLSALFGKRISNLGLRIGLVENTFGVGADYYFFDEAFRVSADIWDFNSDDPLSERAHLKLTTAYTLFKYITFEAGYDQILNNDLNTFFIGAGLRFEDDDLKYLIGSMATAAF
ncbi:MAG: MlaD family protein [Candidatus Manganitrophus sp.]|nr:MlaD family protein [Candidatus Manganitrophus sp.]